LSVTITDPLGHSNFYQYDNVRKLTQRSDPNGVPITYAYVGDNRLEAETMGGNTRAVPART
jgi:YD repeat-containing protein